MAKMNFDEEGLLEEPCLSCDKGYIDNLFYEWCCDEKECLYKAESNEEIIETLKYIKRSYFGRNDTWAIKKLDKAIEALDQQGWIPVEERLPDKEGQYLVTVQGFKANYMEFANFSLDLSNVSRLFRREKGRSGWWGCDDGGWYTFIYSGVIAWMPLPKPYEKEEKR